MLGSGCGSVGRAVASDARGPRFESPVIGKNLYSTFTFNYIEKAKIKKKRPGMAHLKNKLVSIIMLRSSFIFQLASLAVGPNR